MKERQRELLRKIGDCLDVCIEIECKNRSNYSNKWNGGCDTCETFQRMQVLRNELDTYHRNGVPIPPTVTVRVPEKKEDIRTYSREMRNQKTESRVRFIHKQAKIGVMKSGDIKRELGISGNQLNQLMWHHVGMSYSDLVKKYEQERGNELEQSDN